MQQWPYIRTSLTRISNLDSIEPELRPIDKDLWRNGDYVAIEATNAGMGQLPVELSNGRMMEVMRGDRLIGALGIRHATLEATGSWQAVGSGHLLHVLTGAGLLGHLTSKSVYIPALLQGQYLGHLFAGTDRPLKMGDFLPEAARQPLNKPVILLVGTSMSAGKTTAGRIVIRQLKQEGQRVVAAKLTGAGRYKDILALRDAGADYIFDFVDVGLPSSICPPSEYLPALNRLLGLLAATDADIAVIEIGASPLEPYNGDIAIREIQSNVKFTILCASDPYAVLGIMAAYGGIEPDVVSGTATNTIAGRELVEKLCVVRALNLIEPETLPELRRRLKEALFN